jgi:hypothetical protein
MTDPQVRRLERGADGRLYEPGLRNFAGPILPPDRLLAVEAILALQEAAFVLNGTVRLTAAGVRQMDEVMRSAGDRAARSWLPAQRPCRLYGDDHLHRHPGSAAQPPRQRHLYGRHHDHPGRWRVDLLYGDEQRRRPAPAASA